jgi:hypothetical protein
MRKRQRFVERVFPERALIFIFRVSVDLCASVVSLSQVIFTTETQRLHRDTEKNYKLRTIPQGVPR